MKLKHILTLFTLVFLNVLQAQDWSTAVAPIIYNKCANCHHSGGAGHANFTEYDTVKAYAASINYYVSTGTMPPWPPDANYKTYAHERRLSNAEVSTITNWISNNTPLGDTNLAPPKPVYTSAALLSQTPDGTIKMPTYTIAQTAGSTSDIYINFAIPINNATAVNIKGFEFLPGNTAFVHHALIYVDTGNAAINLDAASAGPGYHGFGGAGTNTAKLIGAYVPGTMPFLYPNNFGINIPANATLIFAMHYPAAAIGQIDSSKINYFLGTVTRPVTFSPILNHSTTMVNGPLSIPAYTTKTFVEKYTVPVNISVFGVAPHMHLIGKSIKTFGVKANLDTIPLINIPKWDFKWQGMYYFKKVEKIPAATNLWSTAFYDNTAANFNNPNNPPQLVTLGENTDDEMMLTYFAYTPYQTGDENIVLENETPTAISVLPTYKDVELFPCYPNPTTNILYLKYYTKNKANVQWRIINMQGIVLKNGNNNTQSYQVQSMPLQDLPAGVYQLQLLVDGKSLVQKFTKL